MRPAIVGATLRLLLGCLVAGFAVHAFAGETQEPLILERTIPLAKVSGRIDHMAVDLRRGRLVVAELGNNNPSYGFEVSLNRLRKKAGSPPQAAYTEWR